METTKKYPIMPYIHITNHRIAKLISNLDPSKAAGPDKLKPKILKELALHMYVSPIYKKGSKYSPENYRSISLTCICCKILEHIVVRAR
jgi:hypothetical protein